jgi:hypothetical protein
VPVLGPLWPTVPTFHLHCIAKFDVIGRIPSSRGRVEAAYGEGHDADRRRVEFTHRRSSRAVLVVAHQRRRLDDARRSIALMVLGLSYARCMDV